MLFPIGASPMAISGRVGSYDGSRSSHATGTKASTSFFNGGNNDDFDTKDHHHVPIWGWVLIGVGAGLVLAFVVSFFFNALHERRAAHSENRKPSYGRAALNGLKVALFFWVFAAIAQGVRSVLGRGKKASATTSYSKVVPTGANYDNKDARSSRSYNSSMAYGGNSGISDDHDLDDVSQEPWSSAAYGDGGSGHAAQSGHRYTASNEKYEPYSSGAAIGTAATTNTTTTAVSVGSPANVPYSPNSAYTSVSAGNLPPAVHITPAVSPLATPLPTPAAVTEPLMGSSTPSATYVPGHDERPTY
ncbi:hypothetical protein HMPREF1624_06677 [Sporothrix schenckii ATCC 58251]|uniref:Uncharacterized protein n=1 Tax=Sporothrix schenckii (strain ATCC 58251 / de Perez 2211183) TaxID=1391915 RepID=U7PSA1_SPOS1|nr:hypothetical protein HMPREF1624_06677 [Sporothrix schenckii ATCC 58251]